MLLFVGGMHYQRYLTEHKEPKLTASEQSVKSYLKKKIIYQFNSVTYTSAPVANIMQHFGKFGNHVTVYVNQHYPKKIYLIQGVTILLIFASVLIGWSVLLVLVLVFAYWFIHKIKVISSR